MLPCHSSGHSSGCFTRNGHLRPLAAHTPVAIRSHSQPLAATRVAASGRFTDNGLLQPIAVNPCGHSQPLAATRVAASGREWPLLPSGRKWPQVAAPPKWPQVAASGRSRQIRASGRKWPRVAAFGQINFHPQSNPPVLLVACSRHSLAGLSTQSQSN